MFWASKCYLKIFTLPNFYCFLDNPSFMIVTFSIFLRIAFDKETKAHYVAIHITMHKASKFSLEAVTWCPKNIVSFSYFSYSNTTAIPNATFFLLSFEINDNREGFSFTMPNHWACDDHKSIIDDEVKKYT